MRGLTSRLFVCGLLALFGFGVSDGWAQTAAVYGEVTDAQKQIVPGALVTVTNIQTGSAQTATSDERGAFRFGALQPGRYRITAELTGFKTSVADDIRLSVDTNTRQNLVLELGTVAETVQVLAETTHINTTDASLGNPISREQIRNLPVEAQNVVHLLSLQPGAVFVPVQNAATVDPRYGAVAGARADQQNVTLDGVDVNDAQLQTAYTSATSLDAGGAAGVPRQHVELQRRQRPFERTAGVARDAQWHEPVRWLRVLDVPAHRDLEQRVLLEAFTGPGGTRRACRRGSTRTSYGGSFGGPIRRNRLFFFGNLERLKEQSETPVVRAVPSNSFRDGVLMYQCAVAALCPGGPVSGFTRSHTVPSGWYGMTPAQIAGIDVLGIGPSRAASTVLRPVPLAERARLAAQQHRLLPLCCADRERVSAT